MGKSGQNKIIRKNILVRNFLLLDGYSRAGKFLLGKILDGFEGVEHFQHVSSIEQMPYLVRLGVISQDVAVAMMRVAVDENAYHLRIGRNLNFRSDDSSSIMKFPRIGEYMERSLSKVHPDIVKKFKKRLPFSVFIAHEALANIKVFFTAFPAMKTISLQRHPVDLIYSWWQRGWGERETSDPLCFHPSFAIKGNIVPWYACGWHSEYKKSLRLDRVIMIMKTLHNMSRKSYGALPAKEQKNILFLAHEELIENPWEAIRKIQSFLKIPPGDFMSQILSREKCQRLLSVSERKRKTKAIQRKASKKCFETMIKLAEQYESCRKTETLKDLYLPKKS